MKTPAKESGFGTRNVRKMLRPGPNEELIPQRKQCNIHVMAIREIRWQGEAITDLRTHTSTLPQTGKHIGRRKFGVAVTVDNRQTDHPALPTEQ